MSMLPFDDPLPQGPDLETLLRERSLSIVETERRAGLGRNRVWCLVRGVRDPANVTIRTVFKLAQTLGLTVDATVHALLASRGAYLAEEARRASVRAILNETVEERHRAHRIREGLRTSG
jgi:transcriptional regulator with XRE-family HTH domain